MTSNIKDVTTQIENQSHSVENSASAITQIAQNIESLDSMIQNQASSVVEASAAVEEMIGNIGSVDKSVVKMVEEFTVLEIDAKDIPDVLEELKQYEPFGEGNSQIIFKVNDTKVPVVCCGEAMKELVANTTDAAVEKHVPVVEVNGNEVTVKVGSVTHPMIEEHYIQWISIKTNKGIQFKELKPNQAPEAKFVLQQDEQLLETYEYCNLHSLWVKR